MKEVIKNILKRASLYHPIQSFYRNSISAYELKKNRFLYRKYRGGDLNCNVCRAQYQKFIPDQPSSENKAALKKYNIIAGYGENVYCPGCMSSSRERLVLAFLQHDINVDKKKVLHLSPEKNIYHFLKSRSEVITADLFPGFYKSIDRSIQLQDATQFNFSDNTFDLVIANHIFEHIPDDITAMKEIFRVMKPGAVAILQVPYSELLSVTIEDPFINDPVLQSELYGQKDHVRIYSLNGYVERLRHTGFDVSILISNELKRFSKFALQQDEKFFKIIKPL